MGFLLVLAHSLSVTTGAQPGKPLCLPGWLDRLRHGHWSPGAPQRKEQSGGPRLGTGGYSPMRYPRRDTTPAATTTTPAATTTVPAATTTVPAGPTINLTPSTASVPVTGGQVAFNLSISGADSCSDDITGANPTTFVCSTSGWTGTITQPIPANQQTQAQSYGLTVNASGPGGS